MICKVSEYAAATVPVRFGSVGFLPVEGTAFSKCARMQISDRSLLYGGIYETISETRVGVFYLKVFYMQISFILLIGSGTLSDWPKQIQCLNVPRRAFLKSATTFLGPRKHF